MEEKRETLSEVRKKSREINFAALRLGLALFPAVLGSVLLGRFFRMMSRVKMVAVGCMGVVGGFLVIARRVMFLGFFMVPSSVLVMLRCFTVMFCTLFTHNSITHGTRPFERSKV